MGTDVVAGVGTTVDSAGAGRGLRLRLLGPLTVIRDGVPVALPGSRKTRALLAYLAMAPRPVGRSDLCELLWDVPDDPRGELRWCLSKVRGIVDEPGRRRVEASADMVRLDLGEGAVDALEVAAATGAGVEKLTAERLRELALLFAGDFLQGLEIERSAQFGSWLTAHRRRFRTGHAAILEQLVQKLPAEEAAGHLEKWLELAPFDRRAHEILLGRLARAGQIEEGEAHLAATARLFESEGLDWGPVRDAWRVARVPRVSVAAAPEPTLPVGETRPGPRRASIAVMPFVDRAAGSTVRGGLGDGLAHDVITRLAKLRSLFVIAQGTVLALDGGTGDAARTLAVDYVANGWFRRQGTRITVSVELSETRTARIVWAEVFDRTLDDALLVLEELGNRIVASLAHEIETAERNRAILKPPSSLDAWEAHHRGLWHMYRFDRAENERAQHFFKMAVELDPTFAQAYAGLSFTHFQNAFQGWANRDREIGQAFETAGLGLMVDDRDPAAHWAMGRALWLRGQQDHSVAELETCGRPQPELRAWPLCPGLRPLPGRRPGSCDPCRRPVARAQSSRPDAVRDAGLPGDGADPARPHGGGGRVGAACRRPPQRPCPHPGHRRPLPGARRAAARSRGHGGGDPDGTAALWHRGLPGRVPLHAGYGGPLPAEWATDRAWLMTGAAGEDTFGA